jgi:hypothetical protein
MTSAIDIKHYRIRAMTCKWREQLLTSGHFASSFILLITFRDLRVRMVTRFCSRFLSRVFVITISNQVGGGGGLVTMGTANTDLIFFSKYYPGWNIFIQNIFENTNIKNLINFCPWLKMGVIENVNIASSWCNLWNRYEHETRFWLLFQISNWIKSF